MKTKSILLTLTILFLAGSTTLAQDASFTQWENIPLNFNPALTGNFEGEVRFRAKYRNQWESVLKDKSYRTGALSAEYKFPGLKARKFSVGILGIRDNAGSLEFRNTGIHVSSSVTQHLGNPDHPLHSIAFGLNIGLTNRKIDYENAQWPGGPPPTDIDNQTSFADVSAGLLWQYRSKTHFSFQFGSALHHLNRPDVSFSHSGAERLYHRFNLHGEVEIPLIHTISVIPSFLYWDQGPSEQLLFGFNSRWYPASSKPNFLQLGFFAKTTNNYYGRDINIYVLSATAEINSFLVGFSFDRFEGIESNAYEPSFGYTFGKSAQIMIKTNQLCPKYQNQSAMADHL